ncbi:hypothetical protein MMC14_001327 [Varicellaria rhodocarpa]|nr:hypothetical protein [Varicellaria rhodocarpa]
MFLSSLLSWITSFFQASAVPIHLEDLSYQALTRTSEIRLLELHKGRDGQPIRCTIKHVSLDDSPGKYMALSYTWGSSENPSDILVDGKRLSVTANLYSALRRCRPPNANLTLWIDAICINQLDIPERESQVRMMRRIYQQAQRVVVDLGEEAEGAKLVLPLLSKTVMLLKEHGMDWTIPQRRFEEFGLPSADALDWKALTLLLCQPWFRRVWIIQEFAMAQNLTMVYGNSILPWQDLYWTVFWLSSKGMFSHMALLGDLFPNGLPVALIASTNFFNIVNIRNGIKHQKPKPFSTCLRHVRVFEATDPRDKAYGLLGLVPDVDDFDFEVIYSSKETLENVFIRLARALVESGDVYNVLLAAGTKASSMDVPSWVPDWSHDQRQAQFSPIREEGNKSFYHAGGADSISTKVLRDSRKLTVRGNLFDNIVLLSDTYYSALPNKGKGMRDVMCWEAQSKTLIANLPSYPTGEPVHDVYRRVLVANKDNLDNEASAPYIDNYERMLRMFQIEEQSRSCTEGGPSFDLDNEELQSLSRSVIEYAVPMSACIAERRLCVTRKGYMGLVPDDTTEGDVICVFVGADVPFILRRCDDDDYKLLGDVYVHGIMKGELLEMEDSIIQDVVLI